MDINIVTILSNTIDFFYYVIIVGMCGFNTFYPVQIDLYEFLYTNVTISCFYLYLLQVLKLNFL